MYLKWFPSNTEINLLFFFFQETRLNYRRNICAAARELDCACKRELEKDRQQEQ